MAFVFDPEGSFERQINPADITLHRLVGGHWEDILQALVEEHARETQSRFAAQIMSNWALELRHFWHIVPKEMLGRLPVPLLVEAAE
jgi:glutamate synthase (NADPH/NADH) large chain